jgi:hypothetical protein
MHSIFPIYFDFIWRGTDHFANHTHMNSARVSKHRKRVRQMLGSDFSSSRRQQEATPTRDTHLGKLPEHVQPLGSFVV